MTMNKRLIPLLLLFFPTILALSQSQPTGNQTPNAASRPRRNVQEENAVANLFDTVRKDAKLHRLSRIKDRIALQQLSCTVSVTRKVPLFANGFPVIGNNPKDQDTPSALYKTVNPSELHPELQRIALFERPRGHGHAPGYARYSVAVWPTPETIAGKIEYWVGIELFWSPGNEFFLNHFSDAKEWKSEWKTFVAPECIDVK